ncbi:hypothetical protein Tsubulata_000390 [Turnera subulata]|uniref:Uncharacterized protein n=1 Tax=Turnera subulata TaxID=218843 RepID=A0A9Q0FZK2_9ROSI|nr:hypothetical protein Tsubulata_000390 [Turnera subulata]
MNAASNSPPPPSLVEENNIDSDSDTNADDAPPQYYQPISSVGDDDEGSVHSNSDGEHQAYDSHALDNGHCAPQAADGISSVRLNDDGEDEEEERMREASDSAMRRAFTEDESRRNAPLTAENAARVMEAMRGVSFGGFTPDWAGRVTEDQWIDRLRRLRQSPPVQN